jgi:outer membrane protein assembly factor BamB
VAYDPVERTEVWRADAISGDVGPCPIYADGMVYTTNEYSQVAAIETGGEGNVTDSHVKWTGFDGMSDASSPVCDGKQFIQVHSVGWMTCYDAKEGGLIWEHDYGKTIWASLTMVGDTVYMPGNDGIMHMFKMGAEEYTETGTAALGEKMFATPVFMGGRIYIRGEKSLFCIGKAAE